MKHRSYRFTQLADADVDQIWESIGGNNPDAADRVVLDIYQQVKLLAQFPGVGHRRTDLAENRSLLFFPAGKYMIAYRAERNGVLVIRILHSARNLAVILREQQDIS